MSHQFARLKVSYSRFRSLLESTNPSSQPNIPRYPAPNVQSPATPINMVRASVLTDKYAESNDTKKDISPVSEGSKSDPPSYMPLTLATVHLPAPVSSLA